MEKKMKPQMALHPGRLILLFVSLLTQPCGGSR